MKKIKHSILRAKSKLYNLLRWSEKYAKTDMVYLFRGGFWLSIGQFFGSSSSLLLSVAFANLLPQETYGNYKFVLSVVSILSIPTLSGLNTAVTQAVAQGYDGSLELASKTKLKWGILSSVASLLLAGYYFINQNNTFAMIFLITAIFIPLMESFSVYDSFFQGKKLFDYSVKYYIVSQIFSAISLVGTMLLTKNIYFLLLAYFVPWTISRFISYQFTLKKFSLNQSTNPQTVPYGMHLSAMGIIGTIAGYFDRILVFHYLGPVQLAIYSLAIAVPEQIKTAFKNIKLLALPKFAQRSKEEIKRAITEKSLKLFLIIVAIIIIYIVFAPLFYKLFFPKYLSAIFYSQIYAISLIAIINIFPSAALQSQMAKKELYWLNIAESFLQIFFLSIFIYFYGLMGVIIARVLVRLSVLGVSMILVKQM